MISFCEMSEVRRREGLAVGSGKESSVWKDLLKSVISSLKNGTTKLSHHRVRILLKKHRRKLKRQNLAQARDAIQEKERKRIDILSERFSQKTAEEEREENITKEYEERERKRLHYLWLKREEQAQIDFIKQKEMHEKYLQEKEEQIQKNLEELKKLEFIPASDGNAAANKEDTCKDIISRLPEASESWHNPIAPQNYIAGIVKERETCQFFSKTGACRFGERCSRSHERPPMSCTILIPNMFSHFSLDQASRDEYDTDLILEYEDSDTYQHFKEFYEDVLPEFKKLGKVVQFKVCCNFEPHLRGNVYVQFTNEEEASSAYRTFNGRWYASRQLSCEFSPVKQWKMAICGLFHTKRCPKGRTCNFLHVFRNPTSEFWAADRGIDSDIQAPSFRRSHRSRSKTPERDSSRRQRLSYRSRHTRSPESTRRSKRSRSRSPESARRSKRSRSRSPESARRSKRSRSRSPESSRRSKRSRSRSPESTRRYKTSRSRSPESARRFKRSRSPESSHRNSMSSQKFVRGHRPESSRKCRSRSKTPDFSHRSSSRSPNRKGKNKKSKILSNKKRSNSKSPISTSELSETNQQPVNPPLDIVTNNNTNSNFPEPLVHKPSNECIDIVETCNLVSEFKTTPIKKLKAKKHKKHKKKLKKKLRRRNSTSSEGESSSSSGNYQSLSWTDDPSNATESKKGGQELESGSSVSESVNKEL